MSVRSELALFLTQKGKRQDRVLGRKISDQALVPMDEPAAIQEPYPIG